MIEGVFDFFLYDDIPFNKLDPDLMKKHGNREWSWMTNIAREYNVPFSFAADSKNPRFHAELDGRCLIGCYHCGYK